MVFAVLRAMLLFSFPRDVLLSAEGQRDAQPIEASVDLALFHDDFPRVYQIVLSKK